MSSSTVPAAEAVVMWCGSCHPFTARRSANVVVQTTCSGPQYTIRTGKRAGSTKNRSSGVSFSLSKASSPSGPAWPGISSGVPRE